MSESIFHRTGMNQYEPLRTRPFAIESELDTLIGNVPHLLSAALSTENRKLRFLLIDKQVSIDDEDGGRTGRWSADLMFIDNEGVVTIVEDKLSRNPEIRRKIVGQAIEYAANVSSTWSADRIRDRLEQGRDEESESVLELLEYGGAGDFWQRVSNNLKAGALRIVFVADSIPRELKLTIEFLNRVTDPLEVAGIEVRQLESEDGVDANILIASSVGLSERKSNPGPISPKPVPVTMDELLTAMQGLAPNHPWGSAATQLAEELFERNDLFRADVYKTASGGAMRARFCRRTDDLDLILISALVRRGLCGVSVPAMRWPISLRRSLEVELGHEITGKGGLDEWLGADPKRKNVLWEWLIRAADGTLKETRE